MLYVVAVNTGLRASELGSLTPECCELDGDHPLVRCEGGYTKNRTEAVLPLRRDLADELAVWLADKPADKPVWPGKWAKGRHGAEMIRIDPPSPRGYGVPSQTPADVEYQDDRGRVADFHALRHTFIFSLRQRLRPDKPTSPAPVSTPATPTPWPATAPSTRLRRGFGVPSLTTSSYEALRAK